MSSEACDIQLLQRSVTYTSVSIDVAILGSKDKEGKKSKKRDTKEAADDSVSRKKKKKSLLYVFICSSAQFSSFVVDSCSI